MAAGGGDRGRTTLAAIFEAARDPELSAEELRLWLLYRAHEFRDGQGAFPGDARLARMMDSSPRSVQRYRAELLEAGYLDQTLRGPKPAVYRAVLPDGAAPVDTGGEEDGGGSDDYPAPSDATGGNYPDAFEAAWGEYPDREGSNSKKSAYRAWLARVRNGAGPPQLEEATRAYERRMKREDKVGTRFVKQAATFFGPDDHWREELEMAASRNGGGTDLDRQRAALDVLDGGNGE